ncbi:unnamed protein product, partial [Prorocentrum cordatum]
DTSQKFFKTLQEHSDAVFALEDKDPNSLWMVDPKCMMARWLSILAYAPHRWQAGRHQCAKPKHSCFRNICSFAKFPSRRLYRYLSRAAVFAVETVNPGWACRGLEDGALNLVAQFAKLEKNASLNPKCLWCGTPMEAPGTLVADAGQAYEEIP